MADELLDTFKILEVNPLSGIDKNRSSGSDPDGVLSPDELFNLVPDTRGSLMALGDVINSLPGIDDMGGTLIGHDNLGLVSLRNKPAGFLAWFDGTKSKSSIASGMAGEEDTTHLPGAGPYKDVENFFLRTGDWLTEFEPFGVDPIVAIGAGDSSDLVSTGILDDINWASGAYATSGGSDLWVLIGASGVIYSGSVLSTMTLKATATNTLHTVRQHGGWFIIVGDNGEIWRNDTVNDVSAFSQITLTGTGSGSHLTDLVYDEVSSAWIAVGDVIFRSLDDGATWTFVSDTSAGVVAELHLVGVAVDEAGSFAAVSTTMGGNHDIGFMTSADGITWSGQWTFGFGTLFPFSVAYGAGIFVAVGNDGTVYNSADGVGWTLVASGLGDATGQLNRVIFASDGAFYLCGSTGKVYKSEDGTAWTAIAISGLTADLNDVFEGPEGNMYVVGEGSAIGLFRASFGLEAGTYTVYTVVSVPTRAGMVVVDLHYAEYVLAGEAGNTITVTLPTKAVVKTAASSPAWLTDDFLDKYVYVDIYLKSAIDQTGDTEANPIISDLDTADAILAASLRFDTSLDRTFKILENTPLGRILGTEGNVFTMSMGTNNSTLHLDRVYTILANTRTNVLTSGDDVEVTANQVISGTVISYSDIGFANLSRPGNYLPISPSDSDRYIGMLSTPSGLLVFFTNEVHVVTGDPFTNNLTVQLYPAMIGADVDTVPTKLGGVAFCVWKGEVYALSGGSIQKLSGPVHDREDLFVDIVMEPATGTLVCRTNANKLYRYVIDHNFWYDDPFTDDDMYPISNPDDDGVRYWDWGGDDSISLIGRGGAAPDLSVPYITWYDVDFGNKYRVDTVVGVRFSARNYWVTTDPDDYGYTEGDVPRLYYRVTDEDLDTKFVRAFRYEEEFRFYLPRGLKSKLADLRIEFRGMSGDTVIDPHIQFFYVPSARSSHLDVGDASGGVITV